MPPLEAVCSPLGNPEYCQNEQNVYFTLILWLVGFAPMFLKIPVLYARVSGAAASKTVCRGFKSHLSSSLLHLKKRCSSLLHCFAWTHAAGHALVHKIIQNFPKRINISFIQSAIPNKQVQHSTESISHAFSS